MTLILLGRYNWCYLNCKLGSAAKTRIQALWNSKWYSGSLGRVPCPSQCFKQMLLYPTLNSNKMSHVPDYFQEETTSSAQPLCRSHPGTNYIRTRCSHVTNGASCSCAALALCGDCTYTSKRGPRAKAVPFICVSSAHSRYSINVY